MFTTCDHNVKYLMNTMAPNNWHSKLDSTKDKEQTPGSSNRHIMTSRKLKMVSC